MKIKILKLSIATALLLSSSLYAEDDLLDGSLEDLLSMESELKADVGSRSGAKNFLDSRSALDVITHQQIEHSGLTSLTDILRYFVAGFNAPETSVADGSDHVRAFTLRGMSPDQILVLVNGKRLHTSALLHVNGTIGRGSSNVDLDTIAPVSIQKIEILRDGAAAQYGSDAIAGVINIILKGAGHKNSVTVHAGQRQEGDGVLLETDAFVSVPMKYDGFVNITMEAKKQDQTDRGGPDQRLAIPRPVTHVGIPDAKNYLAVLNAEIPQDGDLNIYANAIFNYRDSEASAFFRPADHNAATKTIYPTGFLPMLKAKILDYSGTIGVNGEIGDGIFWDISNVYGVNKIEYYVDNSMNYSMGASSPTSFNNGSLEFMQNTTNLDFKTNFDKLDLAVGAEYRMEDYKIESGDLASYKDGGSQGFPGYSDLSAVDADRSSYAFYIDATYNFSEDFSLEGAGRFEDYSDSGQTTNIKLATAYKVIEEVLLRASASTGFRAPSLAQSNYSNVATFGGVTSGTFTPDAKVSKALGAKDLKPEKSKHLAFGTVYQPTKNTSLMIDYFYTYVEDRITLSNPQTLTPAQQAQYNVQAASYFTNAVDTKTHGIDIKLNHKYTFENDSSLNLGVWYNYNKNEVVKFNTQTITRENSFEQIDRMENGQPKNSVKILTSYLIEKLNSTMNISRYGEYSQVIGDTAYNFDAAWTVDLDSAYQVSESFNLAVGVNNLLDETPNKWSSNTSSKYYGTTRTKPYSRYSPFGYSGAYYYVRASLVF